MRKSIARVLTVMDQNQKNELRKLFKARSFIVYLSHEHSSFIAGQETQAKGPALQEDTRHAPRTHQARARSEDEEAAGEGAQVADEKVRRQDLIPLSLVHSHRYTLGPPTIHALSASLVTHREE